MNCWARDCSLSDMRVSFLALVLISLSNSSWIGALVGYYLIGGTFGAGVSGFGLAHILLGILDMFRPSVKTTS